MNGPNESVSARQQQRREDVAAAVWRVLDKAGFAGLSMRAVAAELDATTGVVTHYFPTKRALTAFALELLSEQGATRTRRRADPGLPALRAALMDMLPLDDASQTANRIWISSWDAALADPGHAADHAERYRASRSRVRELLASVLDEEKDDDDGRRSTRGAAGTERRAEVVHAAVLGLAVQAVLDPDSYPAQRQVELLDELLARVVVPLTPQ
ncbi:transcriptional regulator, TetR family [Quadrisphaera granulorum]|uniref:TetR family transcriptional regulator n=1 Tax=Quadrisphaera granulorum TaxID=317664 RepID=A0A316AB48_9ACTN|nr:TetR/AcrR family transcriptional regulator [Quadrisphaera granulorum]PWJ47047.1 TetR family transcriptional regulator [Quadrisphaera granulorum]SZE98948.1 transcriptional regulator, TetR family [Quadrisphaera granulorum]